MPSLSRRSTRGRPCRCLKVLENGMFSVTFEGCGPYLPTCAHAHTRPTRTHTCRAHKTSDTEAHVPRTPHGLEPRARLGWSHQESEACNVLRGRKRAIRTNKQTNKQTDRSVGRDHRTAKRPLPTGRGSSGGQHANTQTNEQTHKQAIKPLADNGRRTRTSRPDGG
jgi:hypothetical protein